MKCPYRTITIVEEFATKRGSITRVDFDDCLGSECPFYGKSVKKLNECTMRMETKINPVCRAANQEPLE